MIYNPHSYQAYTTRFIEDHKISAILLDCGLGKTVITLDAVNNLLFDYFDFRKVLVIAPLRVGRDVWPAEMKKWSCLSNLTYAVAIGTLKERLSALHEEADITIINRENVEWLVEDSGYPFNFDLVVIDELSSFKNPRSKRFRALMQVRPRIKRIIGLTGSPVSNSLMDLFGEYKVLDLGYRLGRFISNYRENYFRPDKTNGQIVFSYKPLPGAEEAIYKKISDITISMKSTDYLDMPELINNEYKVYLSEKEKAIYDSLKRDYILSLNTDEITAANAATLTGKLTQLANGAVYDDTGKVIEIHERKLDALEDLIEAANGKPVFVVYWYKHDLDRIKNRLNSLKIEYDVISSAESIEKWNKGEIKVGLAQIQSCALGLNLQDGGNTIIFYSLCWSQELTQQVIARLWRQGQKSKTVVVQNIVTADTVDERILNALEKKDTTQASLINAVKAEISSVR